MTVLYVAIETTKYNPQTDKSMMPVIFINRDNSAGSPNIMPNKQNIRTKKPQHNLPTQ